MKTIDIALLDSVTGGQEAGFVSPCMPGGELSKISLLDASQKDIALAVAQCGKKLPTKAQLKAAGQIRF